MGEWPRIIQIRVVCILFPDGRCTPGDLRWWGRHIAGNSAPGSVAVQTPFVRGLLRRRCCWHLTSSQQGWHYCSKGGIHLKTKTTKGWHNSLDWCIYEGRRNILACAQGFRGDIARIKALSPKGWHYCSKGGIHTPTKTPKGWHKRPGGRVG